MRSRMSVRSQSLTIITRLVSGLLMASWRALSGCSSRHSVSSKLCVNCPIVFTPCTDCPCRDKSSSVSGGSTPSVGVGDLSRVETSISPSHSVASVLRIPAALDNILSACLAFETSKIWQDSAHHCFFSVITFFFTSLAFFLTFGVSSWINYG